MRSTPILQFLTLLKSSMKAKAGLRRLEKNKDFSLAYSLTMTQLSNFYVCTVNDKGKPKTRLIHLDDEDLDYLYNKYKNKLEEERISCLSTINNAYQQYENDEEII